MCCVALAGTLQSGVRNAELEQAILVSPDDPSAYLVYADWLQARGDPRGELIVLQHRAQLASDPELQREAESRLVAHAAHFLGEFATTRPETFELRWRCGFIQAATIGWETFADLEVEGEQLRGFLQLESARFLDELVLGPTSTSDDMSFGELATVIEDLQPPCLRSLHLGDTGNWDISGTSTAMPASPSIRGLRSLTLRGGSVSLPEIDLPELRTFEVQSGSLDRESLRTIDRARWPKLESLVIWFGDPNYGASGGVEDLANLLDGVGLANLRHLGLQNCAFADQLAERLTSARVLPQLQTLDLSMGNLSDRGITTMLAAKSAFQHLERLEVDDNALTDASWPAARELAKQVAFGTEHTPERAVPRAESVSRYRRYVSVGE